MEGHAQSIEDSLIDSLSFKLKPGASYVTDRKFVTYQPVGGDQYTCKGVKVIKLQITGDYDWLDPSTVKIFFDIQNTTALTETSDLLPLLNGPCVFFRRLRVICGGVITEDIDNYARIHEMFHMMRPTERRLNDFIEGFGTHENVDINHSDIDYPSHLEKGETQTVAFTPLAGILRQEKYLPVKFCPIQIELELVGSADDAVQGANSTLGKSSDFLISNVQLKCDLVRLDNTLDNEYTNYLLHGKQLPIHFTAISSSSQIITSMQSNINVQRNLTRIKSIYVSLYESDEPGSQRAPSRNECNYFWHPMGSIKYSHDKELEIHVQIDGKLYPEYPIRSLAEAFYQLRKSFGIHTGNASTNHVQRYYRAGKFVAGIDMEKVLGSSFTGYNNKSGGVITIKLKGANASIDLDATKTYKVFPTLIYDSILNLTVGGCTVME